MDIKMCGVIQEVYDLPSPIVFHIPIHDGQEVSGFHLCQFFDLKASSWSTEGCFVADHTARNITCHCDHLSSFTSAWGSLVKAIELLLREIRCSNADLINPEKWSALVDNSEWWAGPGAWVLWLSLLMHALLFWVAAKMVAHGRKAGYIWDEAFFLTCDTLWDKKIQKMKAKELESKHNVTLLTKCRGLVSGFIVRKVTSQYLAWHAGLHKDDVKLYRRFQCDEQKRDYDSAFVQLAKHFGLYTERLGVSEARQECLRDSFPGLYVTNFLSLQPLLHLFLFGITISSNGRVLLHTVQFIASLVVVGLFFQTDNQSLSYASDAGCADLGKFQRSFAQKAAVGVISTMFTFVPMKALEKGMKHNFAYRESWDEAALKKAIRKRAIKSIIMWSVGSVYIVLMVIFMCVFLATISAKDHWDFAEAVLASLINEFFITPFIVAGLLSLTAWLLMLQKRALTGIPYTIHTYMFSTVIREDEHPLYDSAVLGTKLNESAVDDTEGCCVLDKSGFSEDKGGKSELTEIVEMPRGVLDQKN
jgi:hypothetical protein